MPGLSVLFGALSLYGMGCKKGPTIFLKRNISYSPCLSTFNISTMHLTELLSGNDPQTRLPAPAAQQWRAGYADSRRL